MAVPFCLPDQNNDDAGSTGTSANTSQNTSATSSAMQSPLQSPLTDAHFVQAFYEALYRCTQGGLPETPLMSPLMSPNPDVGCGHYGINPNNGSRFYFPPQIQRAPMSPVTPVQQRHHPQYVGRVTNQPMHAQRVYVPRRVRLSSLGDDELLYEDVILDCASGSDSDDDINVNDDVETMDRDDLMLHLRHMEAREQLQMFPGRVPPPKKAARRKRDQVQSSSSASGASDDRSSNLSSSNNSNKRISVKDAKPKQKSKDSFKWPTVVTVVVIAVGCGILVSR